MTRLAPLCNNSRVQACDMWILGGQQFGDMSCTSLATAHGGGCSPRYEEPERGFYRALQLCEGRREEACTHPIQGKI
jgi:hypothetical protein